MMFAVITPTVLAVVDQSNSCTLIARFCLTAVVFCVGSYDLVICYYIALRNLQSCMPEMMTMLCNTQRLFISQGKVATLIR